MSADASTRRLPETLRLRAPPGLLAAIQAAAARRHQTGSEYVRQVLLDRLEAEGIGLAAGGTKTRPT